MRALLKRSAKIYVDSYRGHPHEVWVLSILTFINRFGTMVLPFLTIYLTTVLDFTLNEAGQLMGAFGVGSLGGSYIGGKLSDRFDSRIIISGSLILGGVFFIGLQFFDTYLSIMLMIFFAALFGESYRPAVMTAVSEVVPPTQTARSIAFLRLAINLGFSAAPALGGVIAVSLGYHWLFWIDGATCILAALYFIWASRTWNMDQEDKDEDRAVAKAKKAMVPSPSRNPTYLWFLLMTFLMGFTFIQWFHTVPVFIKTEWGFDETYVGVLMGGGSLLIVLLEMPTIDLIEKAKKIVPAMVIGLLLISVSFLPLLLPGAVLIGALAMFLLVLGEILQLPLGNSIALNLSPKVKKGEYMAWFWMCWSAVNITGPILGFGFADLFGFEALWILLFILDLVSLVILIKLRWRLTQ